LPAREQGPPRDGHCAAIGGSARHQAVVFSGSSGSIGTEIAATARDHGHRSFLRELCADVRKQTAADDTEAFVER
jgi:hypothetical protein